MSSKKEIVDAFSQELMNTPEYRIVLNIKQFILDEIAAPNIQESITYVFETTQSEYQRNTIKLCMILEFGFYTDNLNESCVIIDMKKFLQ
jgi:hypothetical protein